MTEPTQPPRTMSPEQLAAVAEHVNDTLLYLQGRAQRVGALDNGEATITDGNIWAVLDVLLAAQLLTAFKHLAKVIGHVQSLTDGLEAPDAAALVLGHLGYTGKIPGRYPVPSAHQRRVIELIEHATPAERMTIATSYPALVQAWFQWEDRGAGPLTEMAAER